ncbi:MAG TPA: amino acid ABC transporter permease [Stellaceae bacterium]|nr:amino acid ABC transporter permease [Stellaceae bacterium]
MDFSVVVRNLPYLSAAFWLTLETAVLVIAGGTVAGVLLGLARGASARLLRGAAALYIGLIRGTPLLVVLFVVYFALPPLIGHRFTAYEAAVIGFIAFIAAYIAEDVRSGILSVPGGQMEAALASGLSRGQTLRLVVLPQAIRRMIPALFNQFVRLLKFTSVASVIGVTELTGATLAVNARAFQPLPLLAALALAYFVACYALSLIGRWLNRRYAIAS